MRKALAHGTLRKLVGDSQQQLREALQTFIESGDVRAVATVLMAQPGLVDDATGQYPDCHRVIDLVVGGQSFRVIRCVSKGEQLSLVRISHANASPGVPLWLTGDGLRRWCADETDAPSKEPTDWEAYRHRGDPSPRS